MTSFDAPISLARARRIRRMQVRAARARERRAVRRRRNAELGQVLVIDPERLRHSLPAGMPRNG